MKKTITTIALVCAASAFTALAQEKDSPAPAAPAAPKHEGRAHLGGGLVGPGGGPMRKVMETLTPAERGQLEAARKTAQGDPAVVAARQKAEAAQKEAREAVRAAMIKADPTVGAVLDKVDAAMKEKQAQRKAHEKPAKSE